MDRSEKLRRVYARSVAALAGLEESRTEAAFAAVPREAFLGPPPWYLAILRHIAGADGHVFAYEINQALAAKAEQNLVGHAGVTVANKSGTSGHLPKVDAIYVSAGTTEPAPAWLRAVRPGGKLLFPLQPKGGFGGMLMLTRPVQGDVWPARFISRAGFIACEDAAQDSHTGERLKAAFDGGN